jgi:hypothetical protein
MEEKLHPFLNATHNCYEKYDDIPPTHTSPVLYFHYGESDTKSKSTPVLGMKGYEWRRSSTHS